MQYFTSELVNLISTLEYFTLPINLYFYPLDLYNKSNFDALLKFIIVSFFQK